MTALERVSQLLSERGIDHALIGAAALAAHGVARSTFDVDLLVADPEVLDPQTWQSLTASEIARLRRAGITGGSDDDAHGDARIPGEHARGKLAARGPS